VSSAPTRRPSDADGGVEQKRKLDVWANFDRLEAAGARHDEGRIDLSLDKNFVARLGEVHVDLAGRAGWLRFAPFERAAKPSRRNGKADAATRKVEIVNGDDEGAAIRHGTSIKATELFCQPRTTC
jgi:hypothetical protein